MDWGFVLGGLAAFLGLAVLATLLALLNLRIPPRPSGAVDVLPTTENIDPNDAPAPGDIPQLDLQSTAPADMADDEAERVSILVAALIAGRVRKDSGNFTASLLAYRGAKDVLSVIFSADNPLHDLELLEHAEEEMRG